MADGLRVTNVVESKFKSFQKYPNLHPYEKLIMKSGDLDYQLSMDNSGNATCIYIPKSKDATSNGHVDQMTDILYHIKTNSTRNLVNYHGQNFNHYGLDSVQNNEVGHKIHVRKEKQDSDGVVEMKEHSSKMQHTDSSKQGYITVHYNDLDFVKDLFVNEDTAQSKVCKIDKNEVNGNGSCFEGKYRQLRKEYIERGRAKEREYQLQRKKEGTSKDFDKTYSIIRYDIAAPAESGSQSNYTINNKVDVVNADSGVKSDAGNFIGGKGVKNSPSISSSKSLNKFDAKFVRNTRFGSHEKTTAYRPSTCLDDHRRNKLQNIFENQVNDIDIEEGKQIWKEVDAITEESVVPLPLKSRRKTNCRFRDIHTSNNSVEFLPSFEREASYKESSQRNIWNMLETNNHDVFHSSNDDPHMKSIGSQRRKEGKPSPSLDEDKKKYGRFNRSDHGIRRHSSAPVLQGTSDHGNMFVAIGQNNTEKIADTSESFYGSRGKIMGTTAKINKVCHSCLTRELGYGSDKWVPQSGVRSQVCNEEGLRMTTTLPRIAPANTPLPPGVCQSIPPRSHSSASMYGPYPPKELSSSVDFLKIPGRINPLAPPPPRKRINWSWETVNQHWENDKRRLLMQAREHTRYHSAWSKAFYGAPAEKEAYRRHFREVLKQQMADRENSRREEIVNKVKETERAVKYDEQCRANDAQEYFRKHSYLMLYRDGNKQQMEEKWAEKKFSKVSEDRIDRERLRYNPINWSCSLK